MRRALLLAAASLVGCSFGFSGEGFSTRLAEPDAGGVLPRALILNQGSNDTLIARFDDRGDLTGASIVGDQVVVAAEWQIARAPISLDTPWVRRDSAAQLGFSPLLLTEAGVLQACDRGALARTVRLGRIASTDAGVSPFEDGSSFQVERRECAWLSQPGFVMAVGGTTANEVRLASIEVAPLVDGVPGTFRLTSPFPVAATAVAATLVPGRLFLCGGYGESFPNNRTDQCFEAPVSADGDVGPFTELPRLPVSSLRGTLLRVRDRLHLLGPDIESIADSEEIVFSLDLTNPSMGWRRSTVRFPWDVDRALLVTP
jgi:hypothetical protein